LFQDCSGTQLNATAQSTSTSLAGTITGSWGDPIATPACCNAPNTKSAAFPSIKAVSNGFTTLNSTRAPGVFVPACHRYRLPLQ
jgi:hypothetical protein